MIAARSRGRGIRLFGILIAAVGIAAPTEQNLPLKKDSLRFAVIGDMGTGEKAQYEVAQQMERSRETTGFDFVLMDRKDVPSAGAGETPIMCIAPAVGNAIFAASNIRLRSMPMVPEGLRG